MAEPFNRAEYEAALARGKAKLLEPHVMAVRYLASDHLMELEYTNGMALRFKPSEIEEMQRLSVEALSTAYLTPGGEGLIFDEADVAINLAGLVATLIPLEAARYAVAAANGRVTSAAKAEAARSNGAKGGRPRRPKDL